MARRRSRSLTLAPSNPDELPLAFSIGEHLAGTRSWFADEDTGRRLAGARLSRELAAFRFVPTDVEVSGKMRTVTMRQDRLRGWTRRETVLGPLDSAQLGRIVHAIAREQAKKFGPGNTPPELYVMEIVVQPHIPRVAPVYETLYIDRLTGAVVERSTWERSRAQLRAAARRSGRRPQTGRYIRTRIQTN